MIKFTQHQEAILKANFEKHGEAFMRDKLVEELSELLCELCKHKTKGNRIKQISEEFADVCVVLKQFGVTHRVDIKRNIDKSIEDGIYVLSNIHTYVREINGSNVIIRSYFEYIDFSIVQSTIDAKILKMEGKNIQSLPYEVNH